MSLLSTRQILTNALSDRLSSISEEDDLEQFMQQGDLILVDLILTPSQQDIIDEVDSCFSESSRALISMACEEIAELKHDLVINGITYNGILLVDFVDFDSGDKVAVFQVDSISRT